MGKRHKSSVGGASASKRSRSQRSKIKDNSNMNEEENNIKRRRLAIKPTVNSVTATSKRSLHKAIDFFTNLSLEIICQILEYLPIWDVMKLECQCHHLQKAVCLHLQLITDIDFTEGKIHGWMPSGFTDYTLKNFLKRCPQLMYIYGLHMEKVNRRRQRGSDTLSIPGIIDALQQCESLAGVETSNIFLLEGILNYLPNVEIMGTFKNRDVTFPIPQQNSISLVRGARLTSLHLGGVELTHLPPLYFLKQLHLKWVRFTDPNPFRDFEMPRLRSFVMNNCAGPQSALKYLPLMTGLATATGLKRLELVRVPFLGGLIYHVVEDSWRVSGFRNLATFKIGACKHVQEADLGYLMITSKNRLEELYIQPSLTRDSFFYSLIHAQVDFVKLHTLHLGFVDDFPEPGKWTPVELTANGLADYVENPAFVTDFGMKCVGQVFTRLTQLKLYNCPQIYNPMLWVPAGNPGVFSQLTDLHLRRCHAVKLSDFCTFISFLPCLENLYLENMFKEPPKGCSRVGLSAGLGVSSAFVSGDHSAANQNLLNPLANQHMSVQEPANQNQAANAAANQESDSEEEEQPVDQEGSFDVHDEDMDNEGDEDKLESMMEDIEDSKQLQNTSGQGETQDACGSKSQDSCSSAHNLAVANQNSDSTQGSRLQEPENIHSAEICEECVEVDGYVWNGVDTENSWEDGMDVQQVGDKIRTNLAISDDQAQHSKSEAEQKDKANVCSSGTADNQCVTSHTAPRPNVCDPDNGTLMECGSSGSKTREVGCEDNRVVLDDSVPCSSNEKPESYQSTVKSSGSKGKLLKNRSMSCYPKGKSMSAAKHQQDIGSVKSHNDQDSGLSDQNQPSESSNTNNVCAVAQQNEINKPKEQTEVSRSSQEDGVSQKMSQNAFGQVRPQNEASKLAKRSQQGAACNKDSPQDAKDKEPKSGQPVQKGSGSVEEDKNPEQKPHPCDRKKPTSKVEDHHVEDDHPQVMVIRSNSLLSLNLRCVGITDLIVTDCKKLSSLTVSGCRVLKTIKLDKVPMLSRTSFIQCPKLRHEEVVDQLCQLPPEKHRLIYLRPVKNYNAVRLEQQLLSSKSYRYHVCLLHDHSPDPEQTLYNRMRVTSWPDLITSINYDLIHVDKHPAVTETSDVISDQYPWRQGVYRMTGKSDNGSEWDLVCDIPWIETLASDKDRMNQSWIYSDSKVGVYSPSGKGHCNIISAQRILMDKIKEIKQSHRPLYLYPVIIYVNLCDLNGVVPDKYA